MKLGTENKNKTIVAGVLFVVALLFVANWLFTSSGDSSATPNAPQTASAAPVPDNSPAPTQTQASAKRREDRKEEKTLRAAWKPSLDPRLNLTMLKSSEEIAYEGKGRNIFEDTPEPEQVKIPTALAPGRTDNGNMATPGQNVPLPPVPKGPPPINLKFFGFANKNGGQRSIFLAQGDSVFVAREGDIIARRYKILRINSNSVDVQDMLSNNKQTLNLTAG